MPNKSLVSSFVFVNYITYNISLISEILYTFLITILVVS